MAEVRLTQFARGGGCACKIPAGELESLVSLLVDGAQASACELLVGAADGDDAAAVAIDGDRALISTTDFFGPVVDDAFDWGRIAAANALSDVYAMGGTPIVALNLLGWPRDLLPMELAAEVLRGGLHVIQEAGCLMGGGHSIDDSEPKYGLAVTGIADRQRLMRIDAGVAGLPLSLTKPLGSGVLNSKHKATGERFPHAIDTMTALNRSAATDALGAGIACATDVTGFGLLGHAFKLARASGVTVRIDPAAVPFLDGARRAADEGYVSGGTRRNLEWIDAETTWNGVGTLDRLLLADAQTSGGLLVAGEIPGAVVIGELVSAGDHALIVG